MLCIGIDPDSDRIAWASMEEGRDPRVGTIERRRGAGKAKRYPDGYTADLCALMRGCQQGGGVIYLEDIYLPKQAEDNDEKQKSTRNVQGFKVLARVQGEILHEARRHGLRVEVVAANTWRKGLLGVVKPRTACKKAAELKVWELLGRSDLSEHEAEAVCIAAYAQSVEGGRRPNP